MWPSCPLPTHGSDTQPLSAGVFDFMLELRTKATGQVRSQEFHTQWFTLLTRDDQFQQDSTELPGIHCFKDLGSLKNPKGWVSAMPTCSPNPPPPPLQTAHSWQQRKCLNSYSESGQQMVYVKIGQSRWLYAKQASAVKTLRAINSSCWVKFFPCPIHYWTVNFVFVPGRHSSSQMTALSIKGRSVTGVQWELSQPACREASRHCHWEILGHINILINMRESITGEARA